MIKLQDNTKNQNKLKKMPNLSKLRNLLSSDLEIYIRTLPLALLCVRNMICSDDFTKRTIDEWWN